MRITPQLFTYLPATKAGILLLKPLYQAYCNQSPSPLMDWETLQTGWQNGLWHIALLPDLPGAFVCYLLTPPHAEWLLVFGTNPKAMAAQLNTTEWLAQTSQHHGVTLASLHWDMGTLQPASQGANAWVNVAPKMGLQLTTQQTLTFNRSNPLQAELFNKHAHCLKPLPAGYTLRQWPLEITQQPDAPVWVNHVYPCLQAAFAHSADMDWLPGWLNRLPQVFASWVWLPHFTVQLATCHSSQGQAVGVCLIQQQPSLADAQINAPSLQRIVFWGVHPIHQQKGIGSHLLTYALTHSDYIEETVVTTNPSMGWVAKQYQQLGFMPNQIGPQAIGWATNPTG
jgi:ribosomal protein S18 acetylase RimI-like enzyme